MGAEESHEPQSGPTVSATLRVAAADLPARHFRKLLAEGTLRIQTQGAEVGQRNGLAVSHAGPLTYGFPIRITDHVNMVLRYVPYVQTNLVLGLDGDAGPEPFALTKRFVDLTPDAFPGYSLLTAFGQAARLNLDYQRAHRVLPFPFHVLNNNQAMNVKPKNYAWSDFYEHVIDLTRYTFSWRAILHRFHATRGMIPRWMHVVRAISSESFGRIKYHTAVRRRLDTDTQFRRYFDQETAELPEFYVDSARQDLGALWEWLPAGTMYHDPNAYLKSERPYRNTS